MHVYISDYPAVLVCSMSDGSERLVVTSDGAPSGSTVDRYLHLPITPSPAPNGSTPLAPPEVPCRFLVFAPDISVYPFEPITAEFKFLSYEWFEDDNFAAWEAALFVDDINISGYILDNGIEDVAVLL